MQLNTLHILQFLVSSKNYLALALPLSGGTGETLGNRHHHPLPSPPRPRCRLSAAQSLWVRGRQQWGASHRPSGARRCHGVGPPRRTLACHRRRIHDHGGGIRWKRRVAPPVEARRAVSDRSTGGGAHWGLGGATSTTGSGVGLPRSSGP